MVPDKQVNKTGFNFTWRLPVDLGFRYLLRLHFCELEYDIKESGRMEFSIFVNEQVVEAKGDLIKWSGGNGVVVYKDYVMMMEGDRMEGKRDLLIALRPPNHGWTEPIDATIKGVEVFKLSNPNKNLAGVSPVLLARALTSPKPKKLVFASGGNAIATGVVILLTVLNIIVYQLRSLGENSAGRNLSSSTSEGLCRHFSLAELMSATNNFDDELVIGSGGFGKVYKALIDDGATTVALKRCKLKSQGAKEFWTEIEMLSKLRHMHLVSLLGYCDESNEMILVYEFMEQATLADHLYKVDTKGNGTIGHISWEQRLNICIGAARGLDYLHTGIRHGIIHRDVKSTNILLDKDLTAKISDFGLCKLGSTSHSHTHGIKENKLDQLLDHRLRDEISPHCLKVFAEIANSCLDSHPKRRPTMADVVVRLQCLLALENQCMVPSTEEEEDDFSVVGDEDEQFGEKTKRDDSLPRGDAPSSSTSALNSENTQGQNRSKGKVSKVFQRSIEFLAKGVDTKRKKRNVYDSSGEQSISSHSSTRLRLQWKNVTLQFRRFTVGSHIPRNFLSSAASGGNEAYLKGQILPSPDLRIFTFSELRTATKNFRNDRVLREGGFSRVYKGLFDEKNGRGLVFAVKKLMPGCLQGFREGQSYYPKLSDFGLAKMGPSGGTSHVTTSVMGTYGYAAPKYIATGHLYVNSDVYGFGVVLLEMLTGLRAIDKNRGSGRKNLVD
ncbi:hypothetical protein RHGRI_028585 [Rhododendron griersonianum]|uniref:non-specific serine/threonine protein kinase n=1 Tax=Rhododendron griersonianum TaxID=479676 RepID=A0AAV6IK50_9ERIC|nr:hypothetical protein RHGRI_028585 [Rhododendron griersonianum]